MSKREALAAEIDRAIEEWTATQFKWGVSDCMLSIMDIVQRARGYDPACAFRGRYTSAIGAARVLRPFGGLANALQAVAEECGWCEIDPAQGLVGDVGLVRSASLPRAGAIKAATNRWMGRREPDGVTVLTDLQIVKAWRIA